MKSQPLFPIASTYPQFFNTNLVDDSRVIKHITGNWCAVRAFYYQYLKLAYELDVQNEPGQPSYPELLLSTVRQCVNQQNSSVFRNYLKIIQQFCSALMINDDASNFEAMIQNRREIDEAFMAIFVALLKSHGISEGSSIQDMLACLCNIFGLSVTQIDKCIKFEDSDVFVYIQSQSELYLAFLNLEEQQQQNQYNNSIDRGVYRQQNGRQAQVESKHQKKSGKANDTIMNMFGDMLQSSKHDATLNNADNSKFSNSLITNNLNNSLSPGKRQEQVLTSMKGNPINSIMNSYYNYEHGRIAEEYEQQQNKDVVSKLQTDRSNYSQVINQIRDQKLQTDRKWKKNESKVQKYDIQKDKDKDKISGNGRSPIQKAQTSPQPMMYRPNSTNLQSISEVTASRESLLYSNKFNKRDPLDVADQQQKGTFYRQFTNTRILSILPEPQRTNVKMLKNRFIGLHQHRPNVNGGKKF